MVRTAAALTKGAGRETSSHRMPHDVRRTPCTRSRLLGREPSRRRPRSKSTQSRIGILALPYPFRTVFMRKPALLVVAIALLVAGLWGMRAMQTPKPQFAPQLNAPIAADTPTREVPRLPAFLPTEAMATIVLIQRGGPFPHPQDGGVFGNREHRLPERPRGYYREYTVDTPGSPDRGARRIVTGGTPPEAWYYSDDHYQSFKAFDGPTPDQAP
ncbi:ribonuclease [Xanthomonas euvesicatoria pv. vesicatoria str. 85-10]|uniref:Ribonuclease n=8 Tax=Xanthomonas TaxID=338 RepID=Q3BSE8_XANE5|nr:ribonuclease [Xanthomonas euvesicatoria pv. vesicatoria str. 85-10]